jgi:serine/threonine-protein kinase
VRQLLGLIGEGGTGQVFRPRDTAILQGVAIKMLPTELADQPGYRAQFRSETHAAAVDRVAHHPDFRHL